jgi:protein involved in polysaccharide export with SLBB domain
MQMRSGATAVALTILVFFEWICPSRGQPSELPGLQAGDRLKITIYGKPDASGEVMVGEDGLVSVPLLGPVLVTGQTIRQVEANVRKSLSEMLHQPTFAGVELVERLPFYVLGAVNSPGSFPYKRSLSVLQAVAIAGGLESLARHAGAMIDAIREQGRVGVDTENLKRDLADRARLIAERDGSDHVVAPRELVGLIGRNAAAEIANAESKVLADETHRLKNEKAALQEAVSLGQEELQAYQEQLEQLSHQENVVQSELNGLSGLREQGLISRVRVFDLQKNIPALRAEKRAVLALIARAKQGIASATQSLANFDIQHKLDVARKIAKLDQSIAQAESTMRSSSRIAQLGASNVMQSDGASMNIEYEITRGDATLAATEMTAVLPGDTIRVMLSRKTAAD